MCQPDTYCISPSWTVSVDFSTNEVSTAEHFSQSISILSQERDEDAAAEMLLINYGNMCLFSLTVVRSGCALIWVSRKLTSMKMRAVHCEDRARGTRRSVCLLFTAACQSLKTVNTGQMSVFRLHNLLKNSPSGAATVLQNTLSLRTCWNYLVSLYM